MWDLIKPSFSSIYIVDLSAYPGSRFRGQKDAKMTYILRFSETLDQLMAHVYIFMCQEKAARRLG